MTIIIDDIFITPDPLKFLVLRESSKIKHCSILHVSSNALFTVNCRTTGKSTAAIPIVSKISVSSICVAPSRIPMWFQSAVGNTVIVRVKLILKSEKNITQVFKKNKLI